MYFVGVRAGMTSFDAIFLWGQNLLSDSFCTSLICYEDLCGVWSKGHRVLLCTDVSLLGTGACMEIKRQFKAFVQAELSPLLLLILSLIKRNRCSTSALLSSPWSLVRSFRFCRIKWGLIVTLPWRLSPSSPLLGIHNPSDSCYVSKYCLSLNYFIFIANTFECYYSNISLFFLVKELSHTISQTFSAATVQRKWCIYLLLCLPVNKKGILNG